MRAHRDPFKALHMQSLPLQRYLTLHLHIHIFRTGVDFLSVRDRGKTGHRQSWRVFISFQRVFVIGCWKQKEAAEHLAQNSSVQTSISNNTKILGRNQNYHQLLYYELL